MGVEGEVSDLYPVKLVLNVIQKMVCLVGSRQVEWMQFQVKLQALSVAGFFSGSKRHMPYFLFAPNGRCKPRSLNLTHNIISPLICAFSLPSLLHQHASRGNNVCYNAL